MRPRREFAMSNWASSCRLHFEPRGFFFFGDFLSCIKRKVRNQPQPVILPSCSFLWVFLSWKLVPPQRSKEREREALWIGGENKVFLFTIRTKGAEDSDPKHPDLCFFVRAKTDEKTESKTCQRQRVKSLWSPVLEVCSLLFCSCMVGLHNKNNGDPLLRVAKVCLKSQGGI